MYIYIYIEERKRAETVEKEREREGWFPAAHPFGSARVFFPVVSRRIESRSKLISCLCGSTSLPPRHTSGNVGWRVGARVARFPILLKSVQVKSKLYQLFPSPHPPNILWCSLVDGKETAGCVFSNEIRLPSSIIATPRNFSLRNLPRSLSTDNLMKISPHFLRSFRSNDNDFSFLEQISLILPQVFQANFPTQQVEEYIIKHLARYRSCCERFFC